MRGRTTVAQGGIFSGKTSEETPDIHHSETGETFDLTMNELPPDADTDADAIHSAPITPATSASSFDLRPISPDIEDDIDPKAGGGTLAFYSLYTQTDFSDNPANNKSFENVILQEDSQKSSIMQEDPQQGSIEFETVVNLRIKIINFIYGPTNELAVEIIEELKQTYQLTVKDKFKLLKNTQGSEAAIDSNQPTFTLTFGRICGRHCSDEVISKYRELLTALELSSEVEVKPLEEELLEEDMFKHDSTVLFPALQQFVERPRMADDQPKDAVALRILNALAHQECNGILIKHKFDLLKTKFESIIYTGFVRAREVKQHTFGMVCVAHGSSEVLTKYLELLTAWQVSHPNAVIELLTQIETESGKDLRQLIDDRGTERGIEVDVLTAYQNLVLKIEMECRYQDETYLSFFRGREEELMQLLYALLSPQTLESKAQPSVDVSPEFLKVYDAILQQGSPANCFFSFGKKKIIALTLNKRMPWLTDCMQELHNNAKAGLINKELIENILQVLEHPNYLPFQDRITLLGAPFADGLTDFTTRTFGMLIARYTPELLERFFKLLKTLTAIAEKDSKIKKLESIEALYNILATQSTGKYAKVHLGMVIVDNFPATQEPPAALLAYCEQLKYFADKGFLDRIHALMRVEEKEGRLNVIQLLKIRKDCKKPLLKLLQYGLIPEDQHRLIFSIEEELFDSIFMVCQKEEWTLILKGIVQEGTSLNHFFNKRVEDAKNVLGNKSSFVLNQEQNLLPRLSEYQVGLGLAFSSISPSLNQNKEGGKQTGEVDRSPVEVSKRRSIVYFNQLNSKVAQFLAKYSRSPQTKIKPEDELALNSEAIKIISELEKEDKLSMEEKMHLLALTHEFIYYEKWLPPIWVKKQYSFGSLCMTLGSESVCVGLLHLLDVWKENYPLSVVELMTGRDASTHIKELMKQAKAQPQVLDLYNRLVEWINRLCRYQDQEYNNYFRGQENYLLINLKMYLPSQKEYEKALKAALKSNTPLNRFLSFDAKKKIAQDLGKKVPWLTDCMQELHSAIQKKNVDAIQLENILQVLEHPTYLSDKEKIDLLRVAFVEGIEGFTTRTFGMLLTRYASHLTPRFLNLVKTLAEKAQKSQAEAKEEDKVKFYLEDVFHILEDKATGNNMNANIHLGTIIAIKCDDDVIVSYANLLNYFAENYFRQRIHALMQVKVLIKEGDETYTEKNMADLIRGRTAFASFILNFLRNDLWPHGEEQNNMQEWYKDIKSLEESLFKAINNLNMEEKEQCFDEIVTPGTPLNCYFSETYKEKVKANKTVGARVPYTSESKEPKSMFRMGAGML